MMPIYCMVCKCGKELDIFRKVAEMNDDLPKHCGRTMTRKIVAPAVVADIPAYQAVAPDVKTGNAPMIEGRVQHREYLARNGYREVGNAMPNPSTEIKGDFNLRRELTDATRKVLSRSN